MLVKDLSIFNKKNINNNLVFTINTNNTSTGSSANNQFMLPLVSTGTFNFYINWGDGNTDNITSYNQAEVTHTYSSIGTYKITIRGKIKGFRFNSTGDRLKILELKNFGTLELTDGGTDNNIFAGCTNLIVTATDKIRLSGSEVNSNYLFNNCSNLIAKKFLMDTSSLTHLRYVFRNCVKFNIPVSFDCTDIISLEGLFYGCTLFNSNVSLSDTSKCTSMASMFYNCTNFNQDISNLKVNAVTTMSNMLAGCSNLSTTNYSNFLISCASQNVQTGVTLNAVSKYNILGETARNYLTGTKGWIITDGGLEV